MKRLLFFCFAMLPLCLMAQPTPILRNSWSTNTAGTAVQGADNLSVTNLGSTTNWQFFNVGPKTIARLGDVSNIVTAVSGSVTNALSVIQSNGVIVASGVTNLDLVAGTNINWKITNSPAGHVHAAPHVNMTAIQLLVDTGSNSLYTISSNVSQSLVNNSSNSLYTTSSNVSQSLVNNASNSLYTISSNIAQAKVNSASNSLYTISSNISLALVNSSSNSLYTVSSNIAINFTIDASNSLYTVSSNIAQAKANQASNSLYTVSSNISQSLVNNASNSLYTISSNVSQSLANNASNSLYTTSSNVSQSLVNNSSNSLYTTSSNVAQALANNSSNALYTISSNVSQSLVNNGSNSLYTTSSNIAQALANNASNSLYTVSSNVSQSLVNNSSNSLYTISSNIAINFALSVSTNKINNTNGFGTNLTVYGPFYIDPNATPSPGYVWTATNANGSGTWSNAPSGTGTGGATNWSVSTTNAVRHAIVYQGTNATGAIKTISEGANVTITEQETNLVIAASLAGGAASLGDVTNIVESYVTSNATNVFVDASTFHTNWANAISNRLDTFSTALTNADSGILQSSTNFTLSIATNKIDNINGKGTNLSLYGTTSFYGEALSFSASASNSPAANEFPTAQWVSSQLSIVGSHFYFFGSQASNVVSLQPTGQLFFASPVPSPNIGITNSVTLTNNTTGQYFWSAITTNSYYSLPGGVISIEVICFETGSGSATYHAETYMYDETNLVELATSADQNVPTSFSSSPQVFNNSYIATNSTVPMRLVFRLKAAANLSPVIQVVTEGAYDTHAAIALPSPGYVLNSELVSATNNVLILSSNYTDSRFAGTNYFGGFLGVGTNPPFAKLHVGNPNHTNHMFQVDGYSTNGPFVIGTNGWVGIGTNRPHADLDIMTQRSAGGPSLTATQFFSLLRLSTILNSVMDMGINANGYGWIQGLTRGSASTWVPVVINPAGGQVGIGTNYMTGTAKFHVVGDNSLDDLVRIGTTNADNTFVITTNATLFMYSKFTNTSSYARTYISNNASMTIGNSSLGAGATNKPIVFRIGALDVMRLETNGAVSIGGGEIATNGSIGGGTNISIRIAGGTNFVDTTGYLNHWSGYPTSTFAVSGMSNIYALATTSNLWSGSQGGNFHLTNLGLAAIAPHLTNLSGLASKTYTNVPLGGTNIFVRTVGGTNFIDTIGYLNNWSGYPTSTFAVSGMSNIYALATTSNLWSSSQGGSFNLTNLGLAAIAPHLTNLSGLASKVYTNVPLGGTNINVRTAGGTNFIDTIGQLNNWSGFPTSTFAVSGMSNIYALATTSNLFVGNDTTTSNGLIAKLVGSVWTNGVAVTTGATNVNLITGSNMIVIATNVTGRTDIQLNAVATVSSGPAIETNSIWIPAGAMSPSGSGSTAEGGRTSASTGSITNVTSVQDVWDFTDTTNDCVSFNFVPGIGFSGLVSADIYWRNPTPDFGAYSNVVWGLSVQPISTNDPFGSFTYVTNVTSRMWTSNALITCTMPTITITNFNPRVLLDFRLTRLGTNTADVLTNDARCIGVLLKFTSTNWVGGF